MSKAAPPILPSKTGNALKFLRVDADENGLGDDTVTSAGGWA